MSKFIVKFHNWFERAMQPRLRNMVGLDEYFREPQERIETLEYIIDHSLDITKMAKASGEQRQMQIIGTEVLRILHEVCSKYHLTYWIDWGTLLGAVRHGGYIPWDDDLDISMPIDDFKKACEILPKEFSNYKGRRQDYFFPWMNSIDIIKPAEWVNNTIWYQIFPDRFCNSGTDRGRKYHNWSSPDKKASNAYAYGGDLKGVTSKLDYLKELGINGLYFTPINESTSNHKYNTKDYTRIDSSFGNDKDIKNLVKEAHSRGIKVMLDGVFNHSGEEFAPWQDVLKNGRNSRYFDWFMINKYPFSKIGGRSKKGEYYTVSRKA